MLYPAQSRCRLEIILGKRQFFTAYHMWVLRYVPAIWQRHIQICLWLQSPGVEVRIQHGLLPLMQPTSQPQSTSAPKRLYPTPSNPPAPTSPTTIYTTHCKLTIWALQGLDPALPSQCHFNPGSTFPPLGKNVPYGTFEHLGAGVWSLCLRIFECALVSLDSMGITSE